MVATKHGDSSGTSIMRYGQLTSLLSTEVIAEQPENTSNLYILSVASSNNANTNARHTALTKQICMLLLT